MASSSALVPEYVDASPLERELWRQNLERLCSYWESLDVPALSSAHSNAGASTYQWVGNGAHHKERSSSNKNL